MDTLHHWTLLVLLFIYLSKSCSGKYVLDTDIHSTAITCWTCPNMSSNSECNSWAPDIPCPTNHSVCQTVHRLHKQTGKSIIVNKRCSLPVNCDHKSVGCKGTDDSTEMECTSCCNTPYCNEDIPVDTSSAISLSVLQENSEASLIRHNTFLLVFHCILILSIRSVR